MLLPERRRAKPQTTNLPASVLAVLAAFVFLPAVAVASPATALKAFNAGQFTNALTEYERLLTEQTKQQKPEDPRLHFNAGAVAYRAANYTAALQHFTSVLSAPDIQLQAQAYYNLGNVHFRLGQQAENLDKLEESWKEAINQYQHVLALEKSDPDATFNLAFVEAQVKQIALMRELARQAKAAADTATRQRNYRRAREIMEQLLQGNAAAKPFEEFTKKLKDIDEITNPSQP